jgi:hypothetical protein
MPSGNLMPLFIDALEDGGFFLQGLPCSENVMVLGHGDYHGSQSSRSTYSLRAGRGGFCVRISGQ